MQARLEMCPSRKIYACTGIKDTAVALTPSMLFRYDVMPNIKVGSSL